MEYAWIERIESYAGYPEDDIEENLYIQCTEIVARDFCAHSNDCVFLEMISDKDLSEDDEIAIIDNGKLKRVAR